MAFGCCCISAALADAVLNSLDFCANSMRIAANSKFVQMCTYLQRLAPALDRYTAANFVLQATLEAGELIISNLHERSHSEACNKARLTSSGACANGAKVNNESLRLFSISQHHGICWKTVKHRESSAIRATSALLQFECLAAYLSLITLMHAR
eukprot:1293-Heterococcus_DN1.PRE.1